MLNKTLIVDLFLNPTHWCCYLKNQTVTENRKYSFKYLKVKDP